jgi:uncharacterized protein
MMRNAFIVLFLLIRLGVNAQEFPERATTLVSDFTNTLSAGEKKSLEQKLVAFNDSTSTQVAVVVMRSVGDYDIADYSVQLFNNWKIGQSSKNNGVLVLVAKDDRKVHITTGYGLEGVLPDILCKRIVSNDIVPHFKSGDFYGGLDAATNSIMSIVKGEYSADDYLKHKKEKPVIFPFLMFVFIMLIVLFSQFRRVSRYARTNNLAFWAAWALLNASTGRSRGSWGSFSGGSGWGGGGFGGGGFGGFGGGGSGGGGAGGSW